MLRFDAKKVSKTLWGILESAPTVLPASLAAFGAVSIFLLLIDQFELYYVWPIGIVAATAVAVIVHTHHTRSRKLGSRYERQLVLLILLVGVLVWVGVNSKFTSEHVFTNRDPATYTIASEWLIDHNNLRIEKLHSLESVEGVVSRSAGFNDSIDNSSEVLAQGNHVLPALMGAVGKITGDTAMLKVNVVFGGIALLALFALARQIVKPRWALLATVTLACSLPLMYFSRDTYTEPLALAFTFGSLALMMIAFKNKKWTTWLIAGLTLGAAAMTRIDAYLSIAAVLVFVFAVLALSLKGRDRSNNIRLMGAFVSGVIITWTLGFLDVRYLSSSYFFSEWSKILPELILIISTAVIGVVGTVVAWKTSVLQWVNVKIRSKIPKLITYFVLITWLVLAARPLFVQGLKDDAEGTVNWLIWYIGPIAVCLGVIGSIIMLRELIRNPRTSLPLLAVLSIIMATTLLYIIKPSIAPDQVWASRRMLPVVMPGLLLGAAVALQWIYENRSNFLIKMNVDRRVLSSVLATLMVISPIFIALPFVRVASFGQMQIISQVCEKLPSNATVLWTGVAAREAPMATRIFCDASAVGYSDLNQTLPPKPSKQTLSELAEIVYRGGGIPIIGVYDYNVDSAINEDDVLFSRLDRSGYQNVEVVRNRPPLRIAETNFSVLMGVIQPDGSIKPLDG